MNRNDIMVEFTRRMKAFSDAVAQQVTVGSTQPPEDNDETRLEQREVELIAWVYMLCERRLERLYSDEALRAATTVAADMLAERKRLQAAMEKSR